MVFRTVENKAESVAGKPKETSFYYQEKYVANMNLQSKPLNFLQPADFVIVSFLIIRYQNCFNYIAMINFCMFYQMSLKIFKKVIMI